MATETLRLLLPRMSEERESAMIQAVGAVAAVGYLVIWRRTRTKLRELRAARSTDAADELLLEDLEDPDLARED